MNKKKVILKVSARQNTVRRLYSLATYIAKSWKEIVGVCNSLSCRQRRDHKKELFSIVASFFSFIFFRFCISFVCAYKQKKMWCFNCGSRKSLCCFFLFIYFY